MEISTPGKYYCYLFLDGMLFIFKQFYSANFLTCHGFRLQTEIGVSKIVSLWYGSEEDGHSFESPYICCFTFDHISFIVIVNSESQKI